MVDLLHEIVNIFKETELLGEDFDLFLLDSKESRFTDEKAAKVVDLSKRNPLYPVWNSSKLCDVLQKFAEVGVHRLPVHDTQDRSFKRMDNVLSMSAVVSFISKNVSCLGSLAEVTLGEKNIGIKTVLSIRDDAKAFDGFKLMAEKRVTAVAIVDSEGKFVSSLTAKDIKALVQRTKGKSRINFQPLFQNCKEFISLNIGTRKTTNQGSCNSQTTVKEALFQISENHFHRLFIVDDQQKPIGVLSLGDILSFVWNSVPQNTTKKK